MSVNFCDQAIKSLWDPAFTNHVLQRGIRFEDVTELHVTNCGLESLDGIERFVNLETLDASSNLIDAFSSLWCLRKLRNVKLRQNKFNSVCVTQINGVAVLIALDEADAPMEPIYTPTYKLLDLELNDISSVLAEPGLTVEVECLLLANNLITDISGISAFSGINTLDLTGNVIVNGEALSLVPFNPGVRIFMQDCTVINDQYLLELLKRDTDAEIIAPGSVSFDHPRMTKMQSLKLDAVPQKEFMEFHSEFADFRYVGDILPCELKTARGDATQRTGKPHLVVRSQYPVKYLDTVSTMADVADGDRGINVTHNGETLPLGGDNETDSTLSINTLDSPTGCCEDTPFTQVPHQQRTFRPGFPTHTQYWR
uniref:Uncharacterized protein n=1 Tax=Babesia bovis TaxID=5865 RepID=S6CAP7_BABBO|nr:hypothetical protein [Babesia bovis]